MIRRPVNTRRVADAIRTLKMPAYDAIGGMPKNPSNTTESDGVYDYDHLIQPAIQSMVTGNGNGPIIGRQGRPGVRRYS
jgi:hypothetical protein